MKNSSALERYQILNEIGKGSFGIVYKAQDLESRSIVALKKLQIRDAEGGYCYSLLREVSLLRQLSHPNIVKIKDFFSDQESDYIALEYLNTDLRNFMTSVPTRLPETAIRFYTHQILTGLEFCHRQNIIHRDLKPQNLLLNSQEVKIADFGLSKLAGEVQDPSTPVVQTLWYRAPEVLLGDLGTEKIDLWSLGCIFCEMIEGKPLFCGSNAVDQLWKIFRVLGTPEESDWPGVSELRGFHCFPKFERKSVKACFPQLSNDGVDFLSKLLVMDPKKRISAQQAKNHVYLREFNYQGDN
jgi:cyclin-dependent kinase 2